MTALKIRTWVLLLKPPYCKDASTFKYEYRSRFNSDFSPSHLQQLNDVVCISQDATYISLSDTYILAAQLYHLLYTNGGSILFNNLERLYGQCFGNTLKLSDFDIHSVDDLCKKFKFLFFVCGYKKTVLALNRNLAGTCRFSFVCFKVTKNMFFL